jgi:hypothetical protein
MLGEQGKWQTRETREANDDKEKREMSLFPTVRVIPFLRVAQILFPWAEWKPLHVTSLV